MTRLIALLATLLAFGSATQAAQPKWETYSCEYGDLKKDVTLSGLCHKEATEIDGHFAYVLTWPSGNKVRVEYVDSQSGNHIWRMNGEPGVAQRAVLPGVRHRTSRYLYNRAEDSHRPTRRRERQMQR